MIGIYNVDVLPHSQIFQLDLHGILLLQILATLLIIPYKTNVDVVDLMDFGHHGLKLIVNIVAPSKIYKKNCNLLSI
jgi:hypothetical protein